jgi:hypothetical protein
MVALAVAVTGRRALIMLLLQVQQILVAAVVAQAAVLATTAVLAVAVL